MSSLKGIEIREFFNFFLFSSVMLNFEISGESRRSLSKLSELKKTFDLPLKQSIHFRRTIVSNVSAYARVVVQYNRFLYLVLPNYILMKHNETFYLLDK